MSSRTVKFLWLGLLGVAAVIAVLVFHLSNTDNGDGVVPAVRRADKREVVPIPSVELGGVREKKTLVRTLSLEKQKRLEALRSEGDRIKMERDRLLLAAAKTRPEAIVQARMTLYRELLRSWGVAAEEVEKVLAIILNRDESLADLERQAIGKPSLDTASYMKIEVAASDQLKTTLGGENANKLQMWEDSRRDRRMLERFAQAVEGEGMPLSGEQEQAVLNTLYRVRQDVTNNGLKGMKVIGNIYAGEVGSQLGTVLTPDQQARLREVVLHSIYPEKDTRQ
jgi:hypothetical protein